MMDANALLPILANGNKDQNGMMNNPLMWIIALKALGGMGLGDGGGVAVADSLGRIQDGLCTAAVGNANQTAQLSETMNRIASDAAACCCDVKVEMANTGASIREGNLSQTNTILQTSAAHTLQLAQSSAAIALEQSKDAAAVALQNSTIAAAAAATLADCCCENRIATLETKNLISVESCATRAQSAVETAAILAAGTANTQRILDELHNNQMTALRDKNTVLAGELSNCTQNAKFAEMIAAQNMQFATMIANLGTCKSWIPDVSTPTSVPVAPLAPKPVEVEIPAKSLFRDGVGLDIKTV